MLMLMGAHVCHIFKCEIFCLACAPPYPSIAKDEFICCIRSECHTQVIHSGALPPGWIGELNKRHVVALLISLELVEASGHYNGTLTTVYKRRYVQTIWNRNGKY